ncbi:MAG: DciA family protein [Janthinobacterium lividum]
MQDVLRTSLAKSLAGLSPLDRLSAAWPVVAGHAIAERSSVVALEAGVVTVAAEGKAWHRQLGIMAGQLQSDLQRVSRVPLTDILFVVANGDPAQWAAKGVTLPPSPTRKRP